MHPLRHGILIIAIQVLPSHACHNSERERLVLSLLTIADHPTTDIKVPCHAAMHAWNKVLSVTWRLHEVNAWPRKTFSQSVLPVAFSSGLAVSASAISEFLDWSPCGVEACSQGCAVKMIAAILPRRCRRAKSIHTSSSFRTTSVTAIFGIACVVGGEYTLLRGERYGRAICINDMAILSIFKRRPQLNKRKRRPKSTSIPFEPT